jgi:hypothetical protein
MLVVPFCGDRCEKIRQPFNQALAPALLDKHQLECTHW